MSRIIKAFYIKSRVSRLQKCTQGDKGVHLRFMDELPERRELHAACIGDQYAVKCEEVENGLFKVSDELLADGRNIRFYLVALSDRAGRTIAELELPVMRRPNRGINNGKN